MTRADIQALIDARGEITLPHAVHHLDGPLVMKSFTSLNVAGGILVKAFSGIGGILETPLVDQACSWSFRNARLVNGGIVLKNAVVAPNFFELENLQIQDAPVAYDARACGGAWMGSVKAVTMSGCVDGFRQIDGTTMTFTNCFANGCSGKAWDIENVYGASLRSCAADNNTGQAVRFYACDALTIDSWYMEANAVPGCTFLLLDSCHADLSGMVSLGSVMSAAAGQGSTLVQVNAGRVTAKGLVLGGAPKRNPDGASGAGLSQILFVSGGGIVVLSGSESYHADKATGAGTASSLVGAYIDGGGNVIGAAA